MRLPISIFCALLFITPCALADQFCFALAQTLYEQIYCELEVKAQTRGLPSFAQFKKNNEQVQASLLKRPAERNGVKLPLPKRPIAKAPVEWVLQAPATPELKMPATIQSKPTDQSKPADQSKLAEPRASPSRIVNQDSINRNSCFLANNKIQCGAETYQLVGNKHNRHLADNVLSDAHKMALPAYESGQGLSEYLSQAYKQYIEKMCAIGLGGVTMTFGKFSILYQDIQVKGLDFVERFELMYKFLKKDKASMGVSEAAQAPAALAIDNCQLLTQARFVCAYQGRNYIFENSILENTIFDKK